MHNIKNYTIFNDKNKIMAQLFCYEIYKLSNNYARRKNYINNEEKT